MFKKKKTIITLPINWINSVATSLYISKSVEHVIRQSLTCQLPNFSFCQYIAKIYQNNVILSIIFFRTL